MIRHLLIIAILFSNNPKEIARVNNLKKEAEKAFASGEFQSAINNYRYLIDSMDIDEDEIYLNLAHAYYQADDTANARTYYSQASMSDNRELKSIAYQQLGVMSKGPQTLQQSLQYLKASLKTDPLNDDARYDYELVKKLIKEQQQQNQDQQNQDQQNEENQDQENQQNQENQQDQQGEENQDQDQQEQEGQEQEGDEQKEGEQQEQQQQEGEEQQQDQNQEMSTKEKLEQMNISEEKARMILEAMRNGEIQYLQQQKRKATERPKSGKPDW